MRLHFPAPTPRSRCAPCSPAFLRRTTSKSVAPGSKRRSWPSPPTMSMSTTNNRRSDVCSHLHPLQIAPKLRNRRYLVFALAYPLVLFFAVAEPNRHATFNGVAFPVYFMGGMAAVGTMIAVISSGRASPQSGRQGGHARCASTPLRTSSYISAKVLCGYLMALATIALVCLAGSALGVRLSAGEWLTVLGLLMVGLIPFVALGILLGHLVSTDSLTVATGGATTLFALLGGAYGFLIASRAQCSSSSRRSPRTGSSRWVRPPSTGVTGQPRVGSWWPSGAPCSSPSPCSPTGATSTGSEAARPVAWRT